MRSLLIFVLLAPISAFAADWQTDSAHSTLAFNGAYQGQAFAGKFKKFDAIIAYDENHLDASKFDVKVDLASSDTGNPERDESLHGSDFFSVAKYPQAHFVTTSIVKAADGSIEAKGNLTLRDATKPVTLKVKFVSAGAGATLDIDSTLDRQAFNLGKGTDWADVANAVTVHGHLVLKPK